MKNIFTCLTSRSQKPWPCLGVFLLFLAIIFIPRSTYAQSEPGTGVTMTVIVGLDGYCMYERWMPVRITLENTGSDFEGRVEARVADGLSQWRYAQLVSLPAVSRKEVTLFVYLPGGANAVTVSFLTDEGVVVQTARNLSCAQTGTNLVGVWASTPSVFNIFTTLSFAGGRTSVAQLELADIPSHPEGLEMLNMLVVSDVDTGALSDLQRQSLSEWVQNGGRLIVTGGPGWQKTASGLQEILPFQPSSTVTLPGLSGLEWYSPESEALDGETVIALGDVLPSAVVLASQDGMPLILRQKTGHGDVFYLAADPALAPLRSWTGIEQMYQHIFTTALDIPSWVRGFSAWYEASTAVANVPGLGLPSIFLICGFLGLYIISLGPLNYLVLRQLKRRELAWVSIPVLVILFSFVAFVLGLAARGTRPIVNHLSIVQVWPGHEQAYVHGLVGVFSPNRSQYNFEIEGNFLAHPILAGQLGGSSSWQFLQDNQKAVAEDVRVDVGGIEGVVVSGHVPAPEFASDLSMNFSGTNITVQGEVENNSRLTLKDAVVVGPGKAQQIGDFSPGDRESVNLSFPFMSNASPNSGASPLPSYSYDTTLNDFLGTNNIYSNVDQDLARRFNLLQAALGYGGSRGGGIYLLGWTESSPLEVNLDGKGFRAEHTSIYVLDLTPAIQTSNTTSITLPPALFTWSSLDNSAYSEAQPYGSYLYNDTYSFRFQLNQAIAYKNVTALTLHLASYGATGPTSLIISLWDFTNNEWEVVPVENWGDHNLPEPERFVGSGGEIRLQIENPFQNSVEIERSDFTLVVEQ